MRPQVTTSRRPRASSSASPVAAASTATPSSSSRRWKRAFGYEFVNAIVGGVVPKEYIPSIDKGIQEALNTGVIAGYPVVDVKVTLFDGSYHEVDSSEAAFKIAGSMAIKDALKKSDPILLEPYMAVEVETPEEYMGDVMGNLSSRRGKIEGMDDRAGSKVIRAKVPLGEMFGYATDLRPRPRAALPTPCSSTPTSRLPSPSWTRSWPRTVPTKVPRSYL